MIFFLFLIKIKYRKLSKLLNIFTFHLYEELGKKKEKN